MHSCVREPERTFPDHLHVLVLGSVGRASGPPSLSISGVMAQLASELQSPQPQQKMCRGPQRPCGGPSSELVLKCRQRLASEPTVAGISMGAPMAQPRAQLPFSSTSRMQTGQGCRTGVSEGVKAPQPSLRGLASEPEAAQPQVPGNQQTRSHCLVSPGGGAEHPIPGGVQGEAARLQGRGSAQGDSHVGWAFQNLPT